VAANVKINGESNSDESNVWHGIMARQHENNGSSIGSGESEESVTKNDNVRSKINENQQRNGIEKA